MVEKSEPLLLNSLQEAPDELHGQEVFSEMGVPLTVDKKMIGVLIAQSRDARAFSEHEFHLLRLSGKRLATILENVRSEERYRTVVESALDGVIVMGEDCRVTYVNERLLEILGSPKGKVIGGDFREFLDEKSKILLDRLNLQRLKGESVPSCYELSVFHKDGGRRNIEMSSTFMKDSEGNINLIAFVKDITEKRRMEEQLLQAEKEPLKIRSKQCVPQVYMLQSHLLIWV